MKKIIQFTDWLWEGMLLHFTWVIYTMRGAVVLGIFPSTAALFAVIRSWFQVEKDKEETGSLFKKYYVENFRMANALGWTLTIVGFMVYINSAVLLQVTNPAMKFIGYGMVIFFFISVCLISIYMFPLLSHYQLNFTNYLLLALKLSIHFFPYTLLQGAAILFYGLIIIANPPIFILFGMTLIGLFQVIVCNRIFMSVDRMNKSYG